MKEQKFKYIIRTTKEVHVERIFTISVIERGIQNIIGEGNEVISRHIFTGIKDKNKEELYDGDSARLYSSVNTSDDDGNIMDFDMVHEGTVCYTPSIGWHILVDKAFINGRKTDRFSKRKLITSKRVEKIF